MSYILTYTGVKFYPASPRDADIQIEDIAHALSMLCRANGHFYEFFSVAQHSIQCIREAQARGYSRRVQLACLLHDASEAYLSDITRPVKAKLPEYRIYEEQLQGMIYRHFLVQPLTQAEESLVHQVDDAMLYSEFQHYMKVAVFDVVPELKSEPDYSSLSCGEVKRLFLLSFLGLAEK